MFGLVVLVFAALYFSVMFVAVRWAWRKGLDINGSRAQAFRYAALAFLAVYLPVFWDHIPTLVVHRYHCAKDAGFTAYVDAKQWQAKNAVAVAAVNRLSRSEREGASQPTRTAEGFERYIVLGGLLHTDYRSVHIGWKQIPVWRWERRVSDARNGESLATAVDYSSGYGATEDLRWWLRTSSCVASASTETGMPVQPAEPEHILHNYMRTLWGEQP